ncbi:MAG: PilZ domain-containing protein [Gammaproteobacteria bacterium]|nr:PilZ domain-containing protein [Gammaproteobacteria bacterium]
MEHRYNVRIPVAGDISIYFQPMGWLSGEVLDMSAGGACVVLNVNTVPVNAPISVTLRFAHSGMSEWLQLRAMVVRAQNNVIGIMYLESDDYTALGRLLEEGSRIPLLVHGQETATVQPMMASVR